MKHWLVILLVAIVALLAVPASFAAQNAVTNAPVPKYDAKAEATFKGTVVEVRDRICPVSGGMGNHLILKQSDGSTIEVHLASTKFVKNYDFNFRKGDVVEVVGNKVVFEGVDTIFAREVRRGQDEFIFRDKNGKPIW